MNTISEKKEISSVSLMTGAECTARLEPSQNRGIRFHFNEKCVEASVDNVVSTEHCTVVGNKDVR